MKGGEENDVPRREKENQTIWESVANWSAFKKNNYLAVQLGKPRHMSSHISHHPLVYISKTIKTKVSTIQNSKTPKSVDALLMSSLDNVSLMQFYRGLGGVAQLVEFRKPWVPTLPPTKYTRFGGNMPKCNHSGDGGAEEQSHSQLHSELRLACFENKNLYHVGDI